jgi:hypothetical protein
MSILGRLFGSKAAAPEPAGEAVDYNGFRIRAEPYAVGGQFQTAGTIEKDFPDGTRSHRFVRAETHGSKDEAAGFAVTKGKQIIDERGDRIFND